MITNDSMAQLVTDYHNGVRRRVNDALNLVRAAIDDWIEQAIQGPLPDNWREQFAAVLANQAAQGRRVLPHCAPELEEWIEAWATGYGLLPLQYQQCVEPRNDSERIALASHTFAYDAIGTTPADTPSTQPCVYSEHFVATTTPMRYNQAHLGATATRTGENPPGGDTADSAPTPSIAASRHAAPPKYGTHLTRDQAHFLDWCLTVWAYYADYFDTLVNKPITLSMLRKYLLGGGGVTTLAYEAIKDDPTLRQAHLAAVRAALTGQVTHTQVVHFLTEDLTTSLNYAHVKYFMMLERKQDGFSCWYEGKILGRLEDTYDFHDVSANVQFPYLITITAWDGPNEISDRWMADLEDFGVAKSFAIVCEWEFEVKVFVHCSSGRQIGDIFIQRERDR